MDAYAINLVGPVLYWVPKAIALFALVIELVAFVHCALQKREAFPAIGSLSKGLWLVLTGGSALLALFFSVSPMGIIGLIGVIAGAVYILDVRLGLKELRDGSGPW